MAVKNVHVFCIIKRTCKIFNIENLNSYACAYILFIFGVSFFIFHELNLKQLCQIFKVKYLLICFCDTALIENCETGLLYQYNFTNTNSSYFVFKNEPFLSLNYLMKVKRD